MTYADKTARLAAIARIRDTMQDDDVAILCTEMEAIYAYTEAEEFAYGVVLDALRDANGEYLSPAKIVSAIGLSDESKRKVQAALTKLVKDGMAKKMLPEGAKTGMIYAIM